MLEECLSTVTVSSLTGEVKDVGIDEGVRFSGEKKPEIVGETGEEVFHCRYLLSITIEISILIFLGSTGVPSFLCCKVFVGRIEVEVVFFSFFRDDGRNIGDCRTIHKCLCALVLCVPDKTDFINTEVDFGDIFDSVFLLGIEEITEHHIRCCSFLVAVDNLLLGSGDCAVDVDGLNLPTLTNEVES
uniref:Uncharacterized protein n=1 Tax=Siphoviridae sp. ctnpt50 TaxID=2827941 RepID=A0A8S5SE16_9CAUD|nr:MAG TPA: hypothetical protein [Siphoviridae sp. ctnpt50]